MGHFRINGISRRITLTLLCGMLILMLVLGVYMLNVISHTNQESRTYALSMTDNMTDLISNKASAIARVSSLLAQNNYVEDYFDSTNVAQRAASIKVFNSLASTVIGENTDILAVSLTGAEGTTITVGTLMDAVVLSSLENAYPEIRGDTPFSPFFTKALKMEGRLPFYAYVMPIYDTDSITPRRKLASCIVLCDLRRLQEVLDQQLTDTFCGITLTGADGTVLAARSDTLSRSGHREEMTEQPISGTGWTLRYTLDFTSAAFNSSSLGILWVATLICAIMLISTGVIIRMGLAKPVDTIIARLQSCNDLSHLDLHFHNELDIIVDTIEHTFSRLEKESEERIQGQTQMYAMQLHLRESELSALQSQINPHFLYNTLECMRSIGLYYQSPEIVTISTAMADIFRYSIKERSLVTLEREIGIIKKYLSIIDIRFDNRFEADFDLVPETLNCVVPKMTLQPIVENAIYHGLEPRKGKGHLRILSRVHNNMLILMIEDDGLGMGDDELHRLNQIMQSPDAQPMESENGRRSIGLLNIVRRLQLFSDGTGSITVSSMPGQGTSVCVKMPVKEN